MSFEVMFFSFCAFSHDIQSGTGSMPLGPTVYASSQTFNWGLEQN